METLTGVHPKLVQAAWVERGTENEAELRVRLRETVDGALLPSRWFANWKFASNAAAGFKLFDREDMTVYKIVYSDVTEKPETHLSC